MGDQCFVVCVFVRHCLSFIHHAEYISIAQCISNYQTIQIILKPSNSENSEGDGGKEDVYSQMVRNPLRYDRKLQGLCDYS